MENTLKLERTILSVCLNGHFNIVSEIIHTPEIFTEPNHALIYRKMKEITEITTESITDATELAYEYIFLIENEFVSTYGIQTKCYILIEMWMRRELERLSKIYLHKSKTDEDIFEIISQFEKDITGIQQKIYKKGFTHISKPIEQCINELENKSDNNFLLSTGYQDIDKMIGGFKKQDLIIIAARPSQGKTAFMLNIARNIAEKFVVGIFSLEMSELQLAYRLISLSSNKSASDLMSKNICKNDYLDISKGAVKAKKYKIYIDDTAAMEINELRTKAQKMKKEFDMQILFVDYIQLARCKNQQNREREISEISSTLKGIAKDLNIPVVALSQLNRLVESRPLKKPQLSDLRESGAIEQDADMVMMIYRPEIYEIQKYEGENTKGIAVIIVPKNRNGKIGERKLLFVKEQMEFRNLYKNSSFNQEEFPI